MHIPFNRRSVLKMASALGVMTGTAPLAERATAAGAFASEGRAIADALLDHPATNPAAFALEVQGGVDQSDWMSERDSPFSVIAPRAYAEMKEAVDEFKRHHPEYDTDGVTPLGDLTEALLGYTIVAYYEGIRHGAVYENLRLTLAGVDLNRGAL